MDHITPLPAAHAPTEPPKSEESTAPPTPKTEHPTPNTSPETSKPKTGKLIRDTNPVRILLLVVVVFSSLFLLVRTLVVEPFGVPTGSMAPSLIGHHRDGP